MKELLLLNLNNVSHKEAATYTLREAARAVVFDKEGKIALLHVTKRNFYKLPGGGIDKGEDKVATVKRECYEEIGCDVDVIKELGIVTEYNRVISLKQISYGYLIKVIGEKHKPNLTKKEIDDGFEHVWLTYNDAIIALESNEDGVTGNPYIRQRDLTFLAEAKKYLNKN